LVQSTVVEDDSLKGENRTSGLGCLGWRKTLKCDPSGPRDILDDKDCNANITSAESGFCECEGLVQIAAVPCGHETMTCAEKCSGVAANFRWVYRGKTTGTAPNGHAMKKNDLKEKKADDQAIGGNIANAWKQANEEMTIATAGLGQLAQPNSPYTIAGKAKLKIEGPPPPPPNPDGSPGTNADGSPFVPGGVPNWSTAWNVGHAMRARGKRIQEIGEGPDFPR